MHYCKRVEIIKFQVSNLITYAKDSVLRHDFEWISNYDHTIYHREASNERMETTGEWIFELEGFLRWKNEKSGLLWVNGSGMLSILFQVAGKRSKSFEAGSRKSILRFVD